jgi:glycogen synthase
MEIDPKFKRELTRRFEIEKNKLEVEVTENWRKELEAIYKKKHEGINALLIDIRGLMDRMNNRTKTLTSIIREG